MYSILDCIPYEPDKIFIQTPKGEILTIFCEPSDTIENCLAKYKDSLLGGPEERLRKQKNKEFDFWKFCRSSKLFCDGKLITFDDYKRYSLNELYYELGFNFKFGSILYLDKFPFCDIIYDSNKKLRLNIPYDSNIVYIKDIKEQIKKELKIEIKNQELIVNGKILQDSEKLEEFNNIELKIKMSVSEYQELYNKINLC